MGTAPFNTHEEGVPAGASLAHRAVSCAEALKSSCPQLSITGTVTNVCCESTARDAMMLDYRVTMLSDGNAALNDQEHAAALDTFAMFFGDVMTTSEAIARLQARDLVSIEHRKPAQREPIEYEVRS